MVAWMVAWMVGLMVAWLDAQLVRWLGLELVQLKVGSKVGAMAVWMVE